MLESRNMKDADSSCSNTLPNKVEINLDVLGALMMNGVGRHVDSADIIAVNQGSLTERNMQLN